MYFMLDEGSRSSEKSFINKSATRWNWNFKRAVASFDPIAWWNLQDSDSDSTAPSVSSVLWQSCDNQRQIQPSNPPLLGIRNWCKCISCFDLSHCVWSQWSEATRWRYTEIGSSWACDPLDLKVNWNSGRRQSMQDGQLEAEGPKEDGPCEFPILLHSSFIYTYIQPIHSTS